VHLVHICHDSIIYFDPTGNFSYKGFNGIGNYSNYFFSDGGNGLLAANGTTVVRYDNTGRKVWPDSVIYLSDPGNAYAKYFVPDNNGGLIVAYWSTLGGIFAQHTGRNGKLGIVTKVQDIAKNTPASFELYQNYPNPFNPITRIRFAIKTKSHIKLTITDLLGRSITDLANKEVNAGMYEAEWNASYYSSGVYFYTLYINNKAVAVKKLLFTK